MLENLWIFVQGNPSMKKERLQSMCRSSLLLSKFWAAIPRALVSLGLIGVLPVLLTQELFVLDLQLMNQLYQFAMIIDTMMEQDKGKPIKSLIKHYRNHC